MNSNKLAENISKTDITYTEMLRLTGKYEPLTPTGFLALKQKMKESINSELGLIFAAQLNFEVALELIGKSLALSDLYELFMAQKDLAEEEGYVEFDMDFNPDMNSVPTILSNLRRAIFSEIDCVPQDYRLTPSVFRMQTEGLIFDCEQYEKNFPTIIEILQQLRFELNPNDFELLKSEMIKHISARLELKIGLANFAKEFSESQINQFGLIEAEIKKEFRVFISRIDFTRLQSNGIEHIEELMNVLESSFSVRDVANMYKADQQAIEHNLYPEKTASLRKFYDKSRMSSIVIEDLLVAVATIFNAIPYRDSIHTLKPATIPSFHQAK
jgi:tetratricopeptide (TPR) repeat protein